MLCPSSAEQDIAAIVRRELVRAAGQHALDGLSIFPVSSSGRLRKTIPLDVGDKYILIFRAESSSDTYKSED